MNLIYCRNYIPKPELVIWNNTLLLNHQLQSFPERFSNNFFTTGNKILAYMIKLRKDFRRIYTF